MGTERPAAASTRLGKYELLKEQAGSGVASSWVGRGADGKLVDILRVHRHVIKKTELVEALVGEATRAQALRTPNVAHVVDVGVNDGEVFIVLDHQEGELLSALVTQSGAAGLPRPVALRIARDALAGIAAGHELAEPMMHGEFGPHQIRVGTDGVARVHGFGVASALARMGNHGVKNHDRLAYAAPERVKSMSAASASTPSDAKADVFTAGVIVWELVAKQRLFASKIEAAIVQKVLTAPIAALGTMAGVDATVAIDQAVQHALERDPNARAASLDELTDALDASGELATHEEVAAVVAKLAGKSIAARKNELSSLDGPSPSERPPAPKAPVRKATLQGVSAMLDDATEADSPKPPSAQEKAPASAAKPPAPPAASVRAPLVTLDDSWVSSTGDTAVSADTAAAAAAAAAPKAPAPPPPPRRNAATIVGMAPFADAAPQAPPPAPPPPKKEMPSRTPTAAQKSLAEKLADRPAPPPKRANATLLLGSVGELAEAKPAPSPEPAKVEPKPEPPKADEPKPALRSEAPAPTKVEGHTPSPLSLTPSSLGRAASALEGVQPGATLGRYEILMPIARGGMASVWAGRMQGTRGFSRIVAIKTMLPDISDDPDFQTMFLDEARVAARIKHPNVVQIIDLGEQDDVIYLVMDWVEGDTLGALQKAAKPLGGIPLPIVLRIAQQALAGLHAAHELRDDAGTLIDLVHRDVSPGNVLISMQGFVKIVDFGIARSKARMHVTRAGGVVKGKTPYLSPEQLGQLPIDRRSDIFSSSAVSSTC